MLSQYKKFVVILIAFPLCFASVACCCFNHKAHAAMMSSCVSSSMGVKATSPACPYNYAQRAHSCGCSHLGQFEPAKYELTKFINVFVGDHPVNLLVHGLSGSVPILAKLAFDYHSPPKLAVGSLPLYLQISVLRL